MDLPLSDEEFKYIYSKVPRLNVEVVIKTSNGIVLSKRTISPWKNYWQIPGGTVHMGETLEEAVKRIAIDEAGVDVEVKELLGHIVYPSIKTENGLGWPVGIAFQVEIKNGKLQGNKFGEEINSFTELPAKIIPEQKTFIEERHLTQI